MSPDFELVLEDCLARMHAGDHLDDCLASYPAQAEELRPLLSQAAYLCSIPAPSARPGAIESGRWRMLAAFEQQYPVKENLEVPISKTASSRYTERIWKFLHIVLFGKEGTRMKFALRFAMSLVVILLVAGVITVNASASTIPGDPLYGVKLTMEKVQLALTIPEPDRQQLHTQMGNERKAEIEKVLQLHRQTEGEYEGFLESISATECVVSGMKFTITSQTRFEGSPKVGQWVELDVLIQSDGQLIVQELDVENEDTHGLTPTTSPTNDQLLTSTPAVIPSLLPTHLDDMDDDIDDDHDDDDDLDEDLDDDDDDEDDRLMITTTPNAGPTLTPSYQHDLDDDHDQDDDDDEDDDDHDEDDAEED